MRYGEEKMEIVRATQALLGVHSTPSDTWVRCVVERHAHVKKE
jgi:hypothetical protein